MQRAHALWQFKAIDDDQRIVEGIATTPTPDRSGDVMEPAGAQFKLPLPFLWFHNTREPIGEVFEAKVTPQGIRIKAKVSTISTPGPVKNRLDEAWQSFKADPPLVRGLSIGWAPIEASPITGTKYTRFTKWLWGELSAVTVPMNVEASIVSVKQIDQAAMGHLSPGDSGHPVVRARKDAPAMNTIAEQITAFENTRAAKVARMNELMLKSEGQTLDAAQSEEYTTLESEVESIDEHLPRLRKLEKTNVKVATPITPVADPKAASELRGGIPIIQVKPNVPPGTAFTRYVMALAATNGNKMEAIEFSKQWESSTPEVTLALKAAVNPGTIAEPAWAAPLAVVRPMATEFLDMLRPATLLGKIPGLRNVPFNISMPIQTGGGTYAWVGEGAPKPVGQLQLGSQTLGIAKAAGIIVISYELAKISSPSAEAVIRNDMIKGMAEYLDRQFIDPTVAAVANVSPASITNAAVSIGSAGTSPDNARTDIKNLITSFVAVNQSVANAVLILSESNAFSLSVALNPLGQPLYPGLSAKGGTILGLTAVTSQVATTTVALVQPNEILYADDGGVTIDVSREASVEMSTTPTSPAAATNIMVSLWQQNLIGLRAERFINWKRARLSAVRYTTAIYL